jgi:RNase adaptor protein for sRNA GlmZ degradation
LKTEVASLKTQAVNLQGEKSLLKQQNVMRDEWIESLQRSCGDLRAIRQRFLDKYRGKKHKVVKKSIDFGNSISHDPDVVFDASLYEDGHRSDMDTFLPLYGLSPEKTLQLRATGCEYVITAVEAYAAL